MEAKNFADLFMEADGIQKRFIWVKIQERFIWVKMVEGPGQNWHGFGQRCGSRQFGSDLKMMSAEDPGV
jgi:hypothetical protein